MAAIHLEIPQAESAQELAAAVYESVEELTPWMPWCSPDYALDDAVTWIESTIDGHSRREGFEFLIRSADGLLLGCCGLNQLNAANRFANLGYWVRTSAAGHGVAQAAVRILADWAFANTDLERLEIVSAVANRRSQAVARAAGAQQEGILASRALVHGDFQDAVMFSITKTRRCPI